MVVDDAVVVRAMIARWIEAETDMKIVASLRSGREAIEQVERSESGRRHSRRRHARYRRDHGAAALLEKQRDLVVLMASTLTRRNAEVSLRALSLGAADYIPKPETNREFTTSSAFRRELIDKMRALAFRNRRTRRVRRCRRACLRPLRQRFCGGARTPAPCATVPQSSPAADAAPAAAEPAKIQLRPFPPVIPRVLLIGASTGGPQALTASSAASAR